MEEENASLVTENKQLITELEAAHLELASSKTKVQPACLRTPQTVCKPVFNTFPIVTLSY